MKEMKTKWALSGFQKYTSYGRDLYTFFLSLLSKLLNRALISNISLLCINSIFIALAFVSFMVMLMVVIR